jgi:hypothetical protein
VPGYLAPWFDLAKAESGCRNEDAFVARLDGPVRVATAGGFGGGSDPWAGTFPLNPNGRLPTVRSLGRKLTGQVGRWRGDVVLRSVADEHGHARRYWVQIHNPDPPKARPPETNRSNR